MDEASSPTRSTVALSCLGKQSSPSAVLAFSSLVTSDFSRALLEVATVFEQEGEAAAPTLSLTTSAEAACNILVQHLSSLSCDQLLQHSPALTRLRAVLEGGCGGAAPRLKLQVEGALLTLQGVLGTLLPSQAAHCHSAEGMENLHVHTSALFFSGASTDRAAQIAEAMRALAAAPVAVQGGGSAPVQKEGGKLVERRVKRPLFEKEVSPLSRCSLCGLLCHRIGSAGNWCSQTGSISCRVRALSALPNEQRGLMRARVGGEGRDEISESGASQRRAVAGDASSEPAALAAAAVVSSWADGTEINADLLMKVCFAARQAHQVWQLSVEAQRFERFGPFLRLGPAVVHHKCYAQREEWAAAIYSLVRIQQIQQDPEVCWNSS